MTNLLEAPAAPLEKVRAPRSWRALLGLVPFALYLLVFLGGPLYFVISGALSDPSGQPTLENLVATVTQPQRTSSDTFVATGRIVAKARMLSRGVVATTASLVAARVRACVPRRHARRAIFSAMGR